MNAAIRQYRAIQSLALRAETHELATVGCVGHRPEPEPAQEAEPRWMTWLWIACASVPALAICFLFFTDAGQAIVEIIRSAP